MKYITIDIPMLACPMQTGVLRDAATLHAESVPHRYNVANLLRLAADTIDELRLAAKGAAEDTATDVA